jgi:hypothetical protein
MTTVLTLPSAVAVAQRSGRDTYVGEALQDFSEVTIHDSVVNGQYEHQFVLTLLYKPDLGDPSPPFDSNDGNGYPAVPLDPTKFYTVTIEENA